MVWSSKVTFSCSATEQTLPGLYALLLLNVPVDWYRMVIALVLLLAAIGDRLSLNRAKGAA